MAGLMLTVTVDGVQQMARGFQRFGGSVQDFRPAWPAVIAAFHRIELEQFESQGAFGSGGWAPLSENYAKWKQRHYPGRPILVLTGALAKSLTTRSKDSIQQTTRDSLTLGTRVPYAIYHQRGTGKMPARPPVDIPEAGRRLMTLALHRWLVQQAQAAGLNMTGTAP